MILNYKTVPGTLYNEYMSTDNKLGVMKKFLVPIHYSDSR